MVAIATVTWDLCGRSGVRRVTWVGAYTRCVVQDTDHRGVRLDNRFMIIIENIKADERNRSATSLITLASIAFGVATLITGLWIALGVMLFAH
jgi:hypothetical protein